ncbi:hypothetical protein BDU57DRAFT_519924 [Ampelomyces quisqualis]|uniref:Uncharacterized protein n=1 Tax=Ampelomyces quisqualis TaxID=50730 RepID=A0A6A5QJU5_AMPQU|nr:hypothetical protein BDU57DRAFT_519924 [Ampelomyces quisqualis]
MQKVLVLHLNRRPLIRFPVEPYPSHGLPQHDFEFKRQTYKQGSNSKDVLGVMNTDVVEVTMINWNVKSLIEMHRLIVSFDCSFVQIWVWKTCESYTLNTSQLERCQILFCHHFSSTSLNPG